MIAQSTWRYKSYYVAKPYESDLASMYLQYNGAATSRCAPETLLLLNATASLQLGYSNFN